ncbi:MAG: hypothetical protein U1E67_11975 [Hyphomicrobiales bacterium]
MLTRRNVLTKIKTGFLALVSGYISHRTFAAAKAAPAPQRFRENCSFLIDLRASLARCVETGDISINAETSARCPLCKEEIVITAKDAVAFLAQDQRRSA